ncbi:hypothetical protein [Halalkalibacter oceani]|uniref:hypothetical protein n=1 Tax=Halalkalibacter oceani TaxID=1653776 RepID=UPI00339431DC
MNKLMSREEMIQKYARNNFEENYIYNLSDGVYEQVADVIGFLEIDKEKVTFNDILEQAMVACIHTFDFRTKDIIEQRFPEVEYTMMHYKASGSVYYIEMNDEGHVKFEIEMLPEQHMIMTLIDTLDDFENYFYEQGVAGEFILTVKKKSEQFN